MPMLHHISIGVSDVDRAGAFYDATLKTLGFKRVMEVMPYGIAYGETMPEFWVQLPHDGRKAAPCNGTHVCFAAKSAKAVKAFHAAALKAGGTDEGGPGPRPEYSPAYYGAFARDLDGNKIEAVFFDMAKVKKAKAKIKARRGAKLARAAAKKKKTRR